MYLNHNDSFVKIRGREDSNHSAYRHRIYSPVVFATELATPKFIKYDQVLYANMNMECETSEVTHTYF